jgi:hypothetical protein
VTSVTGTAPIAVATGTTTPAITFTNGNGLAINGTAAKVSIGSAAAPPTVSTATADAMTGSMYWDDVAGAMFYRYDNGGTPVWVSATAGGGGSSTNVWTQGTGTLYPTTTSDVVLVGGATSSNSSLPSSLQVSGSGFGGTAGVFRYDNNANGSSIYLAKSRSSTIGTNTIVQSGDQIGSIAFIGADGSTYRSGANIYAEVDGTPGVGDMPGRLVFATTPSGSATPVERMRIYSGGSVAIYDPSNSGFRVALNAGAGTTSNIFTGSHSGTGIFTGVICFAVKSNGDVQNTNGSYTAISDAKLKENIVDAGSQWDDIKSITIRNWNFKEETGHQTHRQIGLIAQELEQVCPGLVFETPDRDREGNDLGTTTKGVNQSVLYMKAVKALQEAMGRIESLEESNADLKARLDAAGI